MSSKGFTPLEVQKKLNINLRTKAKPPFGFIPSITGRSGKSLTGFTLTEFLITLTIFLIITMTVYLTFNLSQKAHRESQSSAEITQNGRVIMERITRELRQAKRIVGDFPDGREDAVDEIIFEDGHIENPYHYIRYTKDNNEIKREVIGYYFPDDEEKELQPWGAVPPGDQPLEEEILEPSVTIGEWVNRLEFWGLETINIALFLEKKDKTFQLEATVFSRNF